jgi:hypothetical protein
MCTVDEKWPKSVYGVVKYNAVYFTNNMVNDVFLFLFFSYGMLDNFYVFQLAGPCKYSKDCLSDPLYIATFCL